MTSGVGRKIMFKFRIYLQTKQRRPILMKKLIFLTLLTLFAGLSLISDTAAQTRGWGYNETGVLGLGNSTNQPTPQTVSALPDATGIGSGIDHTLFLRA